MPTDFSKFSKEAINEVAKKLKDSQTQFQLKYACIKNKKDTFEAHFMDPEKMGSSKDDLAKAHKDCDQQFMVFMRASLRQALIAKLSKVGKDKEALGKAEDHLAGLLNEDQMLTIADTDAAIKKFESHIQRATIENKAGLVATTTDNLEIIALKAKVAQLESSGF